MLHWRIVTHALATISLLQTQQTKLRYIIDTDFQSHQLHY